MSDQFVHSDKFSVKYDGKNEDTPAEKQPVSCLTDRY